ncbi:MAG: NAD-dependent protein deacylase [Alphaproteobacteria bacterium]
MLDDPLHKALKSLSPTARLVFLTGAGISRESGLDTFRDAGGIWSQVRLEDVATPEAFARDPARVHGFYNARRATLQQPHVAPNAAHKSLARLEQGWGGDVLLITQNVDNLHERGGYSDSLLHMHGQLDRVFCTACDHVRHWDGDLATDMACPVCAATGTLRPDIVWFGEMPYHMDHIESALSSCDLFCAIGTSGQVWPAAGFVSIAEQVGAMTIELNLETTEMSRHFKYQITGPASEMVPQFVDALLTPA